MSDAGSSTARWSWLRRPRTLDVVLAVALALTAYSVREGALGPSSLWLDDSWMALVHRVSAPGDIWRVGLTAPGFAFLLKTWLWLVGLTSSNAQAIPFAAGVVTPGVVYLVARRIGLRAVPAALAGVLLVWSPTHAVYSVRVKQYTFDALIVAVLVWLAWRASEDAGARGPWFLAAAVAAAGTVVSASVVPAAAVILVAALLPALRRGFAGGARGTRRVLRSAPVAAVGGYLAFAAVWGLVITAGRVSSQLHAYWEGYFIDGPGDLPRIATSFVVGLTGEEHGLAVAVIVVLFLVGMVVSSVRNLRATAMLWGPFGAALVFAAAGTVPLGTGRSDLYLYPLAALALAWTVDRLGRTETGHLVAVVALMGVLAPLVVVRYPQEDVRPLIRMVEERLEPTDRILLTPNAAYPTALYGPWTRGVRHTRTALGFAPVFGEEVTVIRVSGDHTILEERLGGLPTGTRAWLLSAHTPPELVEGARASLEDLGYRPLEEASRPGAELELWVRVTAGGALPPAEDAGGADAGAGESGGGDAGG